ncbi:MAG TPA: LuxR C-terminal-related transcriptional regulator [Croceibacterium sp.]|jgi:FixJ family two-component response regulator
MEQRLILHIVDGDSRSRAEQARTAFALGHHAEVYSDLIELLGRPPHDGIILLRQRAMDVPLAELFERFGEQGVWLPVIVCAEKLEIERVVGAIKGGALDYLQLPLEAGRLARALARVVEEADAHGRARRRLTEARQRIAMLSKREREVLELLSIGSSNKLIARELTISPRTVEIHRSNMMTKLRAGHSAEAVRIWLEAELEITVAAALDEPSVGESSALALQPDIARMVRERSVAMVKGEVEDDDGRRTKESPGSRRARSG